MDFADYAELRRRAEKRLTVLTVWPLVAFQVTFYGLMVIRSPYDLGIPFLATLMSFCIIPALLLLTRRRTAANKRVRRPAIDETLKDAVEMDWPLEDPTPRQLRMLAALLDDDMETRAGIGRMLVWSSISASVFWVFTYAAAVSNPYSYQVNNVASPFFLVAWIGTLGILRWSHERARRASQRRVETALARASDLTSVKAKRPAEAPWWHDEDEDEKPKRLGDDFEGNVWLTEDGELSGGIEPPARKSLLE